MITLLFVVMRLLKWVYIERMAAAAYASAQTAAIKNKTKPVISQKCMQMSSNQPPHNVIMRFNYIKDEEADAQTVQTESTLASCGECTAYMEQYW